MSVPLDPRTVARALGGEADGDKVYAPGPKHSPEDRSLSILIDPAAPGGFVVYSFSAGDDPIRCRDHVRQKLGLPPWEPKPKTNGAKSPKEKRSWAGFKLTATYNYAVNGELLYQVQRFEHPTQPKRIFAQRPDGKGGWLRKAGERRVLYRGDDLKTAAHNTAFVTEGEKDADRLAKLGFIAVTVAFGQWSEEAIKALAGYEVYILEDNDETGRKKAREAAEALHGVAGTVRIVQLPGLGERQDVSDWLDAGNNHNSLVAIAKATPLWQPPNARADAGGPYALPFVGFDDLQVEVQKPWLLKNVIARGETSSWIGGPGKGKSALLTDVAIDAAANRDWRGYKSKGTFGVVYLAFERGDLTKRRLEAYKRKHGFKGLPIVVVTTPVNLMEPRGHRSRRRNDQSGRGQIWGRGRTSHHRHLRQGHRLRQRRRELAQGTRTASGDICGRSSAPRMPTSLSSAIPARTKPRASAAAMPALGMWMSRSASPVTWSSPQPSPRRTTNRKVH